MSEYLSPDASERREAHRRRDLRYAARDFTLTPDILAWCQTQNCRLVDEFM